MTALYDVAAIGNAIVDVIAPASDDFLARHDLRKDAMTLIDLDRAAALYGAMAPGVETSGGSAANTVAGVMSLGGRGGYIGKVAADQLGEVFAHDIRAIGARFTTDPLASGPATARSLINVTDDGHRSMATYLGAAVEFGPLDVDPSLIRDAEITYLEGYLFDVTAAREAFHVAAGLARAAGRRTAITISDVFVAERWRAELIAFMPHIDVVFANENELKSLYESDDFEAAAARLADAVAVAVVTRSERGSLIRRGDEAHVIPAYPVDRVIDTTGAGDQYAAGVLLGLSRGYPLEVCGRLGALAASEVIAHYGPRPQTNLEALAKAHGLL